MLRLILGIMLMFSPVEVMAMGNVFHQGNMAPEFKLEMTSGASKTLIQAREGKKSILIFWATWCPYCRKALLYLNDDREKLRARNIKVIPVNLGETREEVKDYFARTGIVFDSFIDGESRLQDTYGLEGLPTIFFLDENGIVRNVTHELPPNYEAF